MEFTIRTSSAYTQVAARTFSAFARTVELQYFALRFGARFVHRSFVGSGNRRDRHVAVADVAQARVLLEVFQPVFERAGRCRVARVGFDTFQTIRIEGAQTSALR